MTGIGRDADDRLVNGALENTLKITANAQRDYVARSDSS
jgi:hypothetical protein